jgi:anti-anti-sigma regulatory factor
MGNLKRLMQRIWETMSSFSSRTKTPGEDKAMHVEMAHSAETGAVELKGSWTIERAHQLNQTLIEALQAAEAVSVDVASLSEADLSCLQLLCAAHRTSLNLKKPFKLTRERSATFRQVVHDAGFVRTLGCHQDPSKSCLWVGGWES